MILIVTPITNLFYDFDFVLFLLCCMDMLFWLCLVLDYVINSYISLQLYVFCTRDHGLNITPKACVKPLSFNCGLLFFELMTRIFVLELSIYIYIYILLVLSQKKLHMVISVNIWSLANLVTLPLYMYKTHRPHFTTFIFYKGFPNHTLKV